LAGAERSPAAQGRSIGLGGGWGAEEEVVVVVGPQQATGSGAGAGGPGPQTPTPTPTPTAAAPRLACSLCRRLFGSPGHLREHEYRHALSLVAVSPHWPDTTQATRLAHPDHADRPDHRLLSSQRLQSLLLHHHHHHHRHDLQALCDPGAGASVAAVAGVQPTQTRYLCAHCPASFTLKSNADRHEKTVHLKRKLMRCAFCPKRFRDRTDLHRHLSSVHSGERGYRCPACAKAFSTPKNLATHVKVCCQAPGPEPAAFQEPGWY